MTGLLPLHGSAQDSPPGKDAEKIIQALFECEDEKALKEAITSAQEAGTPRQAILEARFLFLVDQGDFAAVAALGPVLKEQKAKLEQLRANARAISCITLWLSLSSLLLVFPATLFVLVRRPPDPRPDPGGQVGQARPPDPGGPGLG